MKKVIFMTILLLSTVAASAQLSFTTRAGVNVSGVENSDSQMKIGWKVGAGVDYAFSKLFSVRPMLYYSAKGYSYGKNNLGFSADEVFKLNYLELPILASFHFGLGTNISLVANVGPYIGYRLNKAPSKPALDYKKIDTGGCAGLDFVYKKYLIGIEAQYGTSNLAKATNGNLHNINYSIVLGYNF